MLSNVVRYGARAITQVASGPPGLPVSVQEIAEQQGTSAKYLEQIPKALKVGGLVRAIRGNQGGYVLARPSESSTLKDLYETLVGSARHCKQVQLRPDFVQVVLMQWF